MKEIVVLSGKGGTGKTSIVGSFAALSENKVLADCDVDAADLHLILKPSVQEKHEFWSGQTAFIDREKCTECSLCLELCRFNAIRDFTVDPISCEGCGFCSRICPAEAITTQENMAGHWFISDTQYGHLVHARLGIAQENSGKLVALVRQQARQLAEKDGCDHIISDGPPGIGCPVISSLSGANLALLVTEPTLSGIHDLERMLGVCRHFGIPTLELARLSQGEVIGIDIDQPALDKFTRKIKEAGLTDRAQAVNCSMFDMDFADESFDIIWSEGSIYAVGFERGLREWRRFLKSGGFMVVHDEQGNVREKLEQISNCGYELLGYFILSEETWWTEYFAPLEKLICETRAKHPYDQSVLEELQQAQGELDMFNKNPERNSSVYFVMKMNYPTL